MPNMTVIRMQMTVTRQVAMGLTIMRPNISAILRGPAPAKMFVHIHFSLDTKTEMNVTN
jgi:hypothetical protein